MSRDASAAGAGCLFPAAGVACVPPRLHGQVVLLLDRPSANPLGEANRQVVLGLIGEAKAAKAADGIFRDRAAAGGGQPSRMGFTQETVSSLDDSSAY